MNGQHDVEVEEHHHPCSPLHTGEGEIPVGRKVGKTPPLVLPVWETQILIWYRDQHNTVPTTVSWWGQQTYPPTPLVSTSCPKWTGSWWPWSWCASGRPESSILEDLKQILFVNTKYIKQTRLNIYPIAYNEEVPVQTRESVAYHHCLD